MDKGDTKPEYADKGTAARFFYQADWEYECAENCPVARLDEQGKQMGMHSAGSRKVSTERDETKSVFGIGSGKGVERIGDSGGPSRFYHNADWEHEKEELAESHTSYLWVNTSGLGSDQPVQYSDYNPETEESQAGWSYQVAERIAGADPVRYCPKAARKERDAGLEGLPLQELKTHGAMNPDTTGQSHNTTGQRPAIARNSHPTVKPISLCKWLATLLLPPKEYAPRRILIPFCGTMSEGIGALLAGWDEIVGIDSEQDYCDIGEARMEFWAAKMRETGSANPKTILKKKGTKVVSAQIPLEMCDE